MKRTWLALVLLAALPLHAARLDAELLDGGRYSLDEQRGKVTVIVFFAPSSLASRKSMGELQRFHADFSARGVKLIAVSTDEDRDALKAFVAQRRIEFPVALAASDDFGRKEAQRLPIVFVLARDGEVAARRAGLFNYRALARSVEPLLAP